MKAELRDGVVTLTAECEADYEVMHEMKACGVKSMHLRRDAEVNHGPALAGPLEVVLRPFHGDPSGRRQGGLACVVLGT